MHRYQQMVVLLDRKDTDSQLVRYAAMIAAWGTVKAVQFVHVLPQTPAPDVATGHHAVDADLRSAVTKDFAPHVLPMPSVSTAVLSGPLTDCLLAHLAEHHVDLILVGDSGPQHGRRALARRLAMKATCSVLLIPKTSPAQVKSILVPIDFSKHSEDTLRVAVSLARMSGAVCRPLHVYFNEAVVTYEEYDQVLRGQERASYDAFIQSIDCRGVDVFPLFEESSNVAHAIDRIAVREQADLIIMGTRGRSRSASILLGSVTDQVMLETRVPLLAVKHFGAQMTVLEALLDRRFRTGGRLHTD